MTTTATDQQQQQHPPPPPSKPRRNKGADDAKLIFGTVFSLRNMVRKLGGDDDAFISFRTSQYKLHYYETPTNLRFALLTEPGALSMRNVLHQIYINLWVETVSQSVLLIKKETPPYSLVFLLFLHIYLFIQRPLFLAHIGTVDMISLSGVV